MNKKTNLIKILIQVCFLFFIINNFCCEVLNSMMQPKPSDYEYHTHPMYIYYKVNDTLMKNENDTVIRAEFNISQYKFSRSPSQPYEVTWYYISFPNNINIKLIKGDTSTKICTTEIIHYTGYQNQFGGDTMYFAKLDAGSGWKAEIIPSDGTALLSNSSTVPLYCRFNQRIPDYVRVPYRIKMVFLWQGLFSGDTTQKYLNSNNITVYQL